VTESPATPIVSEIEWQVEQFRCTAFLRPQTSLIAADVFRTIADAEPTQLSENRQQATSSSSGNVGSAKLNVIQFPGRVDILLQASDEIAASPEPNRIGEYHEMETVFQEKLMKWLNTNPGLQRLALGVIVLFEVPDRITGYVRLQKLLPAVTLDPDHSSDFSYHINRPRLVNVAENFRIKVNRLSRWGVVASIFQTIAVARGQTAVATNPVLVRRLCRVELDISSDQEISELPPEHVTTLWNRFFVLADEIVSEGDIS
jgi:hypothetical protein